MQDAFNKMHTLQTQSNEKRIKLAQKAILERIVPILENVTARLSPKFLKKARPDTEDFAHEYLQFMNHSSEKLARVRVAILQMSEMNQEICKKLGAIALTSDFHRGYFEVDSESCVLQYNWDVFSFNRPSLGVSGFGGVALESRRLFDAACKEMKGAIKCDFSSKGFTNPWVSICPLNVSTTVVETLNGGLEFLNIFDRIRNHSIFSIFDREILKNRHDAYADFIKEMTGPRPQKHRNEFEELCAAFCPVELSFVVQVLSCDDNSEWSRQIIHRRDKMALLASVYALCIKRMKLEQKCVFSRAMLFASINTVVHPIAGIWFLDIIKIAINGECTMKINDLCITDFETMKTFEMKLLEPHKEKEWNEAACDSTFEHIKEETMEAVGLLDASVYIDNSDIGYASEGHLLKIQLASILGVGLKHFDTGFDVKSSSIIESLGFGCKKPLDIAESNYRFEGTDETNLLNWSFIFNILGETILSYVFRLPDSENQAKNNNSKLMMVNRSFRIAFLRSFCKRSQICESISVEGLDYFETFSACSRRLIISKEPKVFLLISEGISLENRCDRKNWSTRLHRFGAKDANLLVRDIEEKVKGKIVKISSRHQDFSEFGYSDAEEDPWYVQSSVEEPYDVTEDYSDDY